MSPSPLVVHVLDQRGEHAAARAMMVRDAAVGMPQADHVEILLGDGAGSGCPRIARLGAPSRAEVGRLLAGCRREASLAAVLAWSTDAALLVAPERGVARVAVLDRRPTFLERLEIRLRGRGEVELAGWAPWLDGMSDRRRFALEPIRRLEAGLGPSRARGIAAASSSRAAWRTRWGLADDAPAVGVVFTGRSAREHRSARRHGFGVAALAAMAGRIGAVVVDPIDLACEDLRGWSVPLGIAAQLREAPLRRDLDGAIGALDALVIAGGSTALGDPAADLALLPWVAWHAGVPWLAFEQAPWTLIGRPGIDSILLPLDSVPEGSRRLLELLADPARRANLAAVGRTRAMQRPADAFVAGLGGPWLGGGSGGRREEPRGGVVVERREDRLGQVEPA